MNELRQVVAELQAEYEHRLARRAAAAGVTADELERLEKQAHERERQRIEKELEVQRRMTALRYARAPLAEDDQQCIAASSAKETTAVRWSMKFVAQSKLRFLFLCGPNGVGKTFGAACAVAQTGHGIFVRSRRLPEAIRPWGSEADRQRTFDPRRIPLVVLEELGTEDTINQRWLDAWFEFVDDRQCYGHTIVTTNLTTAQIKQRYDNRIIDRLAACSYMVSMEGESMRSRLRGWA